MFKKFFQWIRKCLESTEAKVEKEAIFIFPEVPTTIELDPEVPAMELTPEIEAEIVFPDAKTF